VENRITHPLNERNENIPSYWNIYLLRTVYPEIAFEFGETVLLLIASNEEPKIMNAMNHG
jgi:hypothetical protein